MRTVLAADAKFMVQRRDLGARGEVVDQRSGPADQAVDVYAVRCRLIHLAKVTRAAPKQSGRTVPVAALDVADADCELRRVEPSLGGVFLDENRYRPRSGIKVAGVTVRYDYARLARIGMPEATFCLDKTPSQLLAIVTELIERPDNPVLFTRMSESQYQDVREFSGESLGYDAESATAVMHGCLPARDGTVAVVTAGTSDIPVAAEACRTLEFLGFTAARIVDVGVAGIWRLLERVDEILTYDVVIVVAGMDAALASVVGGLTGQPIIAVPTSTGYGAAAEGETALRAMLTSCAQGITVTNIDNGFGAACAATRILLARNRT